jgi:hypothetical protein
MEHQEPVFPDKGMMEEMEVLVIKILSLVAVVEVQVEKVATQQIQNQEMVESVNHMDLLVLRFIMPVEVVVVLKQTEVMVEPVEVVLELRMEMQVLTHKQTPVEVEVEVGFTVVVLVEPEGLDS